MSEQNRPRWTHPCGIKITDWTVVAAFILSLIGILGAIIAEQLHPTIDIALPETIQIQCSDYDGATQSCTDTANFETVVDLFSIWNKSLVSTKNEVLEKITAVVEFNNHEDVVYSFPLLWKYFTEITDVSTKKKNTGWVLLPKNKIENLETEFVVDHKRLKEKEVENAKWKTFIDNVKKEAIDSLTFRFKILFAHSGERTMI